ncbi:MAG: DNA-directed RNA polymerase subunit beta, partial [Thermodesulfobacteriota bacterium]
SKAALVAKRTGVVEYVDAERIIMRPSSGEKNSELLDFEEYDLEKFRRSNQDTCINQKPLVKMGEKVEKGQVIADGAGTASGELALGTNTLVAFMPWRGYNFEDAIVISEGLIKNDRFTSIHIEEFELQVRDTKRGAEELTREIPNVSEETTANLDERGIIRVGAEVEAGDILVGNLTPQRETEMAPEERLLRAIFGEKAGDVKDASLKAPPGMNGVVMDTKVFSRKEHTEEAKRQDRNEINQIKRKQQKQLSALKDAFEQKMKALLIGETANTIRQKNSKDIFIRGGSKIKEDSFSRVALENLIADEGFTQDKKVNKKIENLIKNYEELVAKKKTELEIELDKISRGAELPPGVVQLVKVSIATERKVSVGDKMAGRHGNKGVVAKIVPVEDMPYLPDGTPIDIILNPLGVPSRMNVGQIL